MVKYFAMILSVFLFLGCGYKPSSYYTKRVIGDKIYAKVLIDINDPENSVLIKDAINEAIVTKFKSSITDDPAKSNSKFIVKFKSKSFEPIAYDKDGYVVSYKAKVSLNITYIDKFGKKQNMDVKGTYDFPIEANSIISDSKRFEAIKFASYKAISEFISKIAIEGMIKGDENGN
ncbi:MAG: hypothetical protein GXO12_04920 [Epsilonproteobacteria bacterium]|nr:hypothetical protein [Campylobacterota bacterium]